MENEDKDMSRVKGGLARAEILSPEERHAIAKKAAIARWGEKPLKVFRKGSFKEDFGIDIDCYVLDDDQKTAVISKRGMGQAIGFSKRGDRLSIFVNSKNMENYVGREIRDKIETEINKIAEEIMPNLEMQIREKFKFDKGNKDKDFKTLLNVFNALDAKTINEGLKLAKNIGKDMNGLVDEPSQKTWKNAVISLLESGGKTSSSFKLLLDWMAKIERSLQ